MVQKLNDSTHSVAVNMKWYACINGYSVIYLLMMDGRNTGKKEQDADDTHIEAEDTVGETLSSEDGATDDEVSEEEVEMSKVEKQLVACEKKCKEYLDGWKRAKADAENDKKYQQKWLAIENIRIHKTMIEKMLPVLDSMELAISQSSKEVDTSGFERVKKQYLQVLTQCDVTIIDPIGETFNPHQHEAVGEKKVEEEERAHTVVEVVRSGAVFADSVIRPALVYVGVYKNST